MQIETGIHNLFCSIGLGIKQSGHEADSHQQPSPKMNDEPAVTAVTVSIAAVVTDSCAFVLLVREMSGTAVH